MDPRITCHRLRICLLALLLACFIPAAKSQVIYGTSNSTDSLWAIDTTTWQVTTRLGLSMTGYSLQGGTSLAYDPVEHETYAVVRAGTSRFLAKIDLATGVCTNMGDLGDKFASIAFRRNGQLFGITGDGATAPETMYLINKATAATSFPTAFGDGEDGEIICYNHDNDSIYHWSGYSPAFFQVGPAVPPYLPTTVSTATTNEIVGALYLGDGRFLCTNLNDEFIHYSSSGNLGTGFGALPGTFRGMVMPPVFSPSASTVCQFVDEFGINLSGIAMDTLVIAWGDGSLSRTYPAANTAHTYTTTGNKTVHVMLNNAFRAAPDTMATYTVSVINTPFVALNPSGTVYSCDSVAVTLNGPNGFSQQWYRNGVAIPGATALSYSTNVQGIYNMVKVNQNGCGDSAAVGTLVMSGFTPNPQLAVDSSACPILSFSAQDPNNITWDWTFGDGDSALAAPGSIQHTYSAGGVYTVVVADSNGCGSGADTLMVTVTCLPAAIGQGAVASAVAFPNPFSHEIKLHFDALPVGDVSYSVMDLQGRRVAEGTLPTSNGRTEHVVWAPVVAGSYVLELRDGAGVSRIRLVKE